MTLALMSAVVAFTYGFYGLFLIYCAVNAANKNGKLKASPIYVKAILYTYLAACWICDFIFNITLGALFFLETPWGHGVLFTHRCASHRHDGDWRQSRAEWVCDGWLNPLESGHC